MLLAVRKDKFLSLDIFTQQQLVNNYGFHAAEVVCSVIVHIYAALKIRITIRLALLFLFS